ncbi:MAG: hypothetical protein GXP24_05955 [Planctomycetes bacterium]|nr:hypothetical protein [Planctomycetota bacterium]
MPTDSLQTSDHLVFEGTLSLTTTVCLGLLLAAIAGWLLWRERQTLGLRWAGLFWLLRMAAMSIAMWMLLGPVHETVKRTTVTQSIAIFADASESMETVDSPDAIDLLRWTLASEIGAEPSALSHCDSMQVAVRVASFACEKASRLLSAHRPVKELKQAVEKTRIATERAAQHCEKLTAQLTDEHEDFAERIARMETILQGPIASACSDLRRTFEDRGPPLVGQLTKTLEVLRDNLEGLSRRLETLTRELAEQLADDEKVVHATDVANAKEWTRREKSTQALDALQENVLGSLADKVQIRKFQFASSLMPIAAERNWSEAANLVAQIPSHTSAEATKTGPPLTDLTAVLQQLTTDRVAQSIRLAIILSDGNHTALSKQVPQDIATQLSDLPVFTVPIGNTTLVRDLRLHRVEAPDTVVVKDSAVIDAIVSAVDCDGLTAAVTLRHDGHEIDRQQVALVGDRVDRRVQFTVSATQLGWQDYELTIEPLEDEASVANNVAPISWEVVRDNFRVLLADSVSHWEFRYLQQLFRRDSHVECDELLFYPRLRGTGEMAVNPRLPERADDWAVYDVVILGDLDLKQLNTASQEALVEYVRERHGHLILLAGRDHMPREYRGKPLMDLLPVTAASFNTEDEGFTLTLTDEGRLHSALAIEDSNQASEAAWLRVYRKKPIYNISEYCRPKPTARTLLRAVPMRMSVVVDDPSTLEDLPAFLCWHQVGGGRVVFMAAAESWKLRFRAEDRYHHRFWGQMLRWITAEDQGSGTDLLRLSTDKKRYRPKDPIEVTVWLKDQTGRPLAGQTLQVSARTLENDVAAAELVSDPDIAGRYFCSLESLPPGAYEIVVSGSVVDKLLSSVEDKSPIRAMPIRVMIVVDAGDNLEMLDTRCNRTLLEQVAQITGGQVVPPTALAEVLQLASLSPEIHETVRHTPLWNRWTNLWIVLGCLVVEWIVRKQKGLV